jgi:hypothetical protein
MNAVVFVTFHNKFKFELMSKAKAYTKMILDRLNKKAEENNIKSASSSNQKTQATPSDARHAYHNPRSFFDHF